MMSSALVLLHVVGVAGASRAASYPIGRLRGTMMMAVNCQSVGRQCNCAVSPPRGPRHLFCRRTCHTCSAALHRVRNRQLARAALAGARARLKRDTAALRHERGIVEMGCDRVATLCGCDPSGHPHRKLPIADRGHLCDSGCRVCLGAHGYHYNVHEIHVRPKVGPDGIAHARLEDSLALIRQAQREAAAAGCDESTVFSVWTKCAESPACRRFRYKDVTMCAAGPDNVHRVPMKMRLLQHAACPRHLCS